MSEGKLPGAAAETHAVGSDGGAECAQRVRFACRGLGGRGDPLPCRTATRQEAHLASESQEQFRLRLCADYGAQPALG